MGIIRVLLFLSIALPLSAFAREEILSFDSHIKVETDGSMWVEEIIKVRAEGKKIKRGIFRDFPTEYKDRLGNAYNVGFYLHQVLRDGQSEPHHTKPLSNGIRIYVGSSNIHLNTGVYTYTLRYRTDRQLGFFEQHDELYWNATGTDWDFPILTASVRVNLPGGVSLDDVNVEGYTGPKGGKGQDYRAGVDDSAAWFHSTRALAAREGLTIVATWPKGYVTEPSRDQKLAWFFEDNKSLLVVAGGMALLLIYYYFSWLKVGKDPESGVVIPHYTPPDGYSPASMRFIKRMGYDNQTFGVAIVNMAVEGYLRIEENRSGTFSLHKTGNTPKLAPGESAIASALFRSGSSSIQLKQSNHARIGGAVKIHKSCLKRDYEKHYFKTNSRYLIPGAVLTLGTIIAGVLMMDNVDQQATTGFMALWLSFWSLGVYALLNQAWKAWSMVLSTGGVANVIKAVFSSVFAIPFVAGEIFGLTMLFNEGSPVLVFSLAIMIGVNIAFYQWMKAPTLIGRILLDEVEGFALYLDVAEKDEMKFKNPPEKTPELFERFLPFAIALGVEEQWGNRFSSVLENAQISGDHYSPSWYSGRSWNHHNLTGFSSAVGSAMTSAISSSSTAPGSSSGSGGGGSSGGGGGGGGGGGW